MSEIIYVLTNEAMPGYVKVGKISKSSIEERVKELSRVSSVPLPFTVFYACTVKDAQFVERQLHDAFDDYRVNPRREFFSITPARIVAALKLVEIADMTPTKDFVEEEEDRKALEEARERRSRFNFDKVKIPVDAELVFNGNENIKAKVIGTHSRDSIEYNGEKISLSRSAQNILGYEYGVAGTYYWMYEGETLDERRRRFDEEEN